MEGGKGRRDNKRRKDKKNGEGWKEEHNEGEKEWRKKEEKYE